MTRYFALFTALIIASSASAEEVPTSKHGFLLPAISIASDYRFNGISLSNREPVLQGSLHWWRPDNYYAGIWLSKVDFQDIGGTSIEIDSYIGRDFYHGRYQHKVEVLYSSFNDDEAQGPTYDFFQFKLGTKRAFEDLSVGLSVLWSPAGSAGAGSVAQLRSDVSYRISPQVKTSYTLGRRWAENGIDRTYWDVGLTFEWKKVDLDIRYVDTNLASSQCFFTDWCEGGLVTKITLASY